MTTRPATSLRRLVGASVLAASLLVLPGTPAPAAARNEPLAASTQAMNHRQRVVVDHVNRARTARSRTRIATNGLMNRRAMNWAAELARCQCLKHRRGPYGAPRGWCAAAENVGRSGNGGTLRGVHLAFMNSPGHRRNVLNRRWTDLGVGVARDRQGEYFVVHAFADLHC